MQIKTISVNLGCKLSPRSYNNIEAHIGATAELAEGDSLEDAYAELSTEVFAALASNIHGLTSELAPYERQAAMQMIGVPPESFEGDDDDSDDGDDNDDPPDGDDEDDYADDVPDEEDTDEDADDEGETTTSEALAQAEGV